MADQVLQQAGQETLRWFCANQDVRTSCFEQQIVDKLYTAFVNFATFLLDFLILIFLIELFAWDFIDLNTTNIVEIWINELKLI